VKKDEDIVLIFPKTKEVEFEDIEIPFSILFVGSYFAEMDSDSSRKVALFDERLKNKRKIIEHINKNRSRYVGISTMSGPQLSFAISISKEIRRASPSSIIIWGGVHPTICPDTVIMQDYVDYVVRGEGEETFYELIKSIERDEDIADVEGITFQRNGKICHNPDRPFMDINKITISWSLLNVNQYIKNVDGLSCAAFITSRGCIYRCKYCWNTVVNKRKYRSWSFDKTIYEINRLLNKGINYFNILDDELSIDRKRFFRLCEYFRDKNVYWSGSLRCDFVAKKDNTARLHNCKFLFLGAESGSQRILDYLKKDIAVNDIFETSYRLKETGIHGNYSWMIGFPNEREDDLYETLNAVDTIAKILPEAAQRIRIYNPYPGTVLYKDALEAGFKPPTEIEGWGFFSREYCVLGYISNPWFLKCISYASFFHFYAGKRRRSRFIYTIPVKILKVIAGWRWKRKYFKFPIEYILIELIRKLINPTGSRYGH
jgi:radical SAM superfamily enzyme YgiQ (UPF0313 family)